MRDSFPFYTRAVLTGRIASIRDLRRASYLATRDVVNARLAEAWRPAPSVWDFTRSLGDALCVAVAQVKKIAKERTP